MNPLFLTKFIPGGWILQAVLAAVITVSAGLAGAKLQRVADAPTIANLRTDVANARGDAKDARADIDKQRAQIALDAQAASESALAREKALQGQVADLTAKLALTDKARRDASARFLDSLREVPREQQIGLSPPVKLYLSRVRDTQSTGSSPTPAPDHHQDGVPVSDRSPGVP